MFFICPECGSSSVAWNVRSSRFHCHSVDCMKSFPPLRADGFTENQVLRLLNLNMIAPESIATWLQRCSSPEPAQLPQLRHEDTLVC